MNIITRITATGFFSGYLPKIPGTWGSFAAALIWWFIPVNIMFHTIIIIVFIFIGVISSAYYSNSAGHHDPAEVVIDEWVGMWITLFMIPHRLWYFIPGFFLFRIFDITKPFFIKKAEKLPSGWGIMADDLLAGIYSRVLIQIGVLFI